MEVEPWKKAIFHMVHGVNRALLRWSLKRSMKRPWGGASFSTNESAWSAMVTGPQSRGWKRLQV